jgi:hypothetical protein
MGVRCWKSFSQLEDFDVLCHNEGVRRVIGEASLFVVKGYPEAMTLYPTLIIHIQDVLF